MNNIQAWSTKRICETVAELIQQISELIEKGKLLEIELSAMEANAAVTASQDANLKNDFQRNAKVDELTALSTEYQDLKRELILTKSESFQRERQYEIAVLFLKAKLQ